MKDQITAFILRESSREANRKHVRVENTRSGLTDESDQLFFGLLMSLPNGLVRDVQRVPQLIIIFSPPFQILVKNRLHRNTRPVAHMNPIRDRINVMGAEHSSRYFAMLLRNTVDIAA